MDARQMGKQVGAAFQMLAVLRMPGSGRVPCATPTIGVWQEGDVGLPKRGGPLAPLQQQQHDQQVALVQAAALPLIQCPVYGHANAGSNGGWVSKVEGSSSSGLPADRTCPRRPASSSRQAMAAVAVAAGRQQQGQLCAC